MKLAKQLGITITLALCALSLGEANASDKSLSGHFARRALAADQRLDFKTAARYYRHAIVLGVCGARTRCGWHARLTEMLSGLWRGKWRSGATLKSAQSLGVALANKALALRADTISPDPRLERLATYFYYVSWSFDGSALAAQLGLAGVFAEQGRRQVALELLRRCERSPKKTPLDYYNIGYAYAALGLDTKALYYLKQALLRNCQCQQWAASSDDFRKLKHDPRFKRLMLLVL